MSTVSPTNTEYSKFLQNIVQDALEAAREMEIDPQDALNHILECIGEDASEKLSQALETSNT